MNVMHAAKTRRVLVIDDDRAIHDDFRKILSPRSTDAALNATELAVFGLAAETAGRERPELSFAYQGADAVLMVRKALEAGQPYAMAFVDVRMPPGCDGIETSARIWRVDPDLQIVLCTAYMDYSWKEMVNKLGYTDRLVILKKPFEPMEVLQLASALTEKWRLHQQAKRQMERLEGLVRERTSVLEETNGKLSQALAKIQTLSGLLPICAGCKKIRDDTGLWSQVETYIAKHSEAKFTHGLCPDCARTYYPDVEYPKQRTP